MVLDGDWRSIQKTRSNVTMTLWHVTNFTLKTIETPRTSHVTAWIPALVVPSATIDIFGIFSMVPLFATSSTLRLRYLPLVGDAVAMITVFSVFSQRYQH